MPLDATLLRRLLRPFLNNVVDTDEDGWHPEVEPRVYETPAYRVFEAAQQIVEARRRWTPVEVDVDRRILQVEARTKRMGYVDDMTIRVEPMGESRARLHVRSASRVGTGDFGKNAERIRELFERLDDALS